MLDAGGGGGAAVGKAVGGLVKMAAPRVAGAPAPAGGGGFTFKAEELDGVIRQWEDLRDALKTDEYDAERMATVKPPGREFASGDFAKFANPSGKAFLEANQRMQKYVGEYIEALRAAKQKITTRDEQSQSDISRAGEQA
ncbi:hypothetical protein [Prauserella muralis]|uniref:Uncharacterized protein n=1 Tax=Prauserella muralis TaxID=588067 RepID=A0A2V4BC54_9PSEU|nr:hypothetical protein [Prauserella muralis]PXY31629.1 hypothetical protein BAY60_04480 [Prauserella muralis]TWE14006.1 hypothetical protein FHX69_6140 [Prauserella muralis]